MLTNAQNRDPANSLGYFVDLAAGTSDKVRFIEEEFMPYRMKLVIYLPMDKKEHWVRDICRVIRYVEGSNNWPLRFEKDNLCEFITMMDMEKLASLIPDLSVYVYGVEESFSFDEDSLRRWRNSALRSEYVSVSTRKGERKLA